MKIFHGPILFAILVSCLFAGETEHKSIYSKRMNKEIPCLIVLPENYENSHEKRSVVYLLHGYSGNYQNWYQRSDLESFADKYNFIIVCPDGGFNSWYLDSPFEPTSQYKSFVGENVVNYIDHNYQTKPHRNSRAITGLSMGGHGALYLALQFPDIFGAAGSMSGVMELKFTTKKYELGEKIGNFETHPENWERFSVLGNVEKFKNSNTALIIDCGVDDVFIESNRLLHKRLLELNIPHDYSEKPGGHSWGFWINSLDYHFLFFHQFFSQ